MQPLLPTFFRPIRRYKRSLRRRHGFVVAAPSRLLDVRVGAGPRRLDAVGIALLLLREIVGPVRRVGLETDFELVLQAHIRGLCKKDSRPLAEIEVWRKPVGVEPTLPTVMREAAGFEDREGHRAPLASGRKRIAGERRNRAESR